MTWIQVFNPIRGNLVLSALVALIPILYFFWALTIRRMKGHIAGLTTLLLALIIAIFVYKMPATMAVMSAVQGGVYGLLPIGWVIFAAVFLFKLTVKTGQFDIIRASILTITEDRRLQVLLIAFSFSAFLEGSSGFGAPVAISAALLVGMGFNPLYAAGLCLVANTAPVAFGAIGTPILALEGPTGLTALEISKMVGRQLPFISFLVPFYLVFIMSGFKKTLEVIPAILVSGGSFALAQFLTSNFMGPELTDILSALVSLVALTLFLRIWQPKTVFHFKNEQSNAEVAAASAPSTGPRIAQVESASKVYTKAQIFKACSPFVVLTVIILIWGIPAVKLALTGQYEGANGLLSGVNGIGKALSFHPSVWGLDNLIISSGKPISAVFKLELLSAAGTAILLAALATKFIFKISWRNWAAAAGETLGEMKFALLTTVAVVGYAYIANASGMITTLGKTLASSGVLFPFVSPIMGWIAVFLTGSDTSANVLFGNLQKVTAGEVGMNPLLAVAANCSGGGIGKMISPQSIAVACAAVGIAGKEADLLRFILKHTLILLFITCILVLIQSTPLFAWMIPK